MANIKLKVEQNVTTLRPQNTVYKIGTYGNTNTIIDGGAGFVTTTFVSGETTKEIGVVPINRVISHIVLEVTTAGSGTCNIGTAISQGLLMTVNENDLSVANQYLVFNNIQTTTNETFNIYFTNNTSSGSVTIYYN